MPEKMIRERPWLRMPNSEISSPSQMANIVPAVILMTIVSDGSQLGPVKPKSLMISHAARQAGEDVDLPDGLQGCHGHSQDIGPLFHPFLAFAWVFFHALLQRWDDRDEELQDDLGGDVRINTHRQDGEVGDRTTRQQIQQADQRTARAAASEDAGDRFTIDTRHGHMRRKAIDRQDAAG